MQHASLSRCGLLLSTNEDICFVFGTCHVEIDSFATRNELMYCIVRLRPCSGRRMVQVRRVLKSMWRWYSQQNLQQSCACKWRQGLCRLCTRHMQHASLRRCDLPASHVCIHIVHVAITFRTHDRTYSRMDLITDGLTGRSTLDGGWSQFGACSKACGGGTHSRTCTNPAPANGGKDCTGDATKACNTQACAGTGCWRSWPHVVLANSCLRGLPEHFTVALTHATHIFRVTDGLTEESQVDGDWSLFGPCSKACGGGSQSRNCSNPAPANGGKDCVGENFNLCNTQTCASTACLCS